MPSFAAVYQQYFDFVWASTRRLGVGVEEVDDVVQEIFIVIHSKLATLQQPDSLRSWIYGIVRRTVSSHRRSARTRKASGTSLAFEADYRVQAPRTPLELVETADSSKLLWALLGTLDEAKREVFALVELEEMSVPEVAEALELPLNTAYSRLRAARMEFEQALERHLARAQGAAGACRN